MVKIRGGIARFPSHGNRLLDGRRTLSAIVTDTGVLVTIILQVQYTRIPEKYKTTDNLFDCIFESHTSGDIVILANGGSLRYVVSV